MAGAATSTLPGFPTGIPLFQETYENWDESIDVPNMWTCQPANEGEVAAVCNWAVGAGFSVRPRGIMHNWSPLTIAPTAPPGGPILLVDLTASMTAINVTAASEGFPPMVTVQTGATMEALMLALQNASGGNGAASGYSFAHIPAPGNITVGGALAINAHGTAVRTPPNDDLPLPYGSLSNQILAFTAIVSEPGTLTYAPQTFVRGQADGEDKAFLTHLGRAFLTSVTLQVTDNYNLRCQSYTTIEAKTLFQAPTASTSIPPNSVAAFLEQSGRVEVIWFPVFPVFGITLPSFPWLKVWTAAAQQPASSTLVTAPYNYAFSDNLSPELSGLIAQIINGNAKLTPAFSTAFAVYTMVALNGGFGYPNTTDLWGASMNTMLYVKDTTLRVTANGYAVQMKKADVQQAVADFTAEFTSLLAQFQSNSLYPINSPLEIRITNLDEPTDIVTPLRQPAQSPVISSLSYDQTAIDNGWDVAVWFDVLTLIPSGDPQHAFDFYTQLEQWVTAHFGAGYRVMVEWSKGWAYTTQGAWTDLQYIAGIQKTFTTGRSADDDWHWEAATLAKYDAAGLFYAPLLDLLFPHPIVDQTR